MTLIDSFRVSAKMCISSLDGRLLFSPFLSRNHVRDSVSISDLGQDRLLRFLPGFGFDREDISSTQTKFDHLEVLRYVSYCIFNSVLDVLKCGKTRSFVFDIR